MKTGVAFTWKEDRIDRGLSWICRQGDVVVGGIAFSYLPSNNGGLFSSNRGKGFVSLVVRHENCKNVLAERTLSASSRNEADKLVRKLIRNEGLRGIVEAAHVVVA